jgi:hypothetical protein
MSVETMGAASLRESAARLASALVYNDDAEFRLALLKRVARRLGEDAGYPAFLKLILIIAESDSDPARRAVATTFATALRRADLPAGQLTSWGAGRLRPTASVLPGVAIDSGFFNTSPKRAFGPIEYLTAWSCQRTQRGMLSDETYAAAMERLIALVSVDADAARLYPDKLEADTRNELEGAYTHATRQRLTAIATAWKNGHPPDRIAAAAISASGDMSPPSFPHGWLIRDL